MTPYGSPTFPSVTTCSVGLASCQNIYELASPQGVGNRIGKEEVEALRVQRENSKSPCISELNSIPRAPSIDVTMQIVRNVAETPKWNDDRR